MPGVPVAQRLVAILHHVRHQEPAGRLAAGGGLFSELAAKGEAVVRVWDLKTGDVHTSRLFYIKDDTLYLCQGLNDTLNGCIGANGAASGPADPLATFHR